MKKLILIVIILFTITMESQIKINGFGKLQLGMTSEEVFNLNNNKTKVYTDSIDKHFNFCGFEQTEEFMKFNGSEVKYYYIHSLPITEEISINVLLGFYEDKLFSILINNLGSSNILELILDKYGKPTITYRDNLKKFISKNINEYRDYWVTTPNVEFSIYVYCSNNISLTDMKTYDILNGEYKNSRKIIKDWEKKEKQKILDKL